jgi:hypothetical protein
MKVQMVGLMAMALLSSTWILGGTVSRSHPGHAVDSDVAARIHGGGCQNQVPGMCKTNGSCAATSVVGFTGCGNYQPDTSVQCGNGTACISFTLKPKLCGN